MAARRRRTKRHPLAGRLRYETPALSFQSAFVVRPLQKGKRKALHTVENGSCCREEVLHETQRDLKYSIFRAERIARTWETKEIRTGHLDLDDPATKQPGLTFLRVDVMDEAGFVCMKPCCRNNLVYLLDAIVGQVGVLFDPDWYQGNWWETQPEDNREANMYSNFSYYGVSNFILRHPALLHSVLGLFRQAVLLYGQNLDEPVLSRLDRVEVKKALTEGDPELALRNLRKIRTWIEVPGPARSYPFPTGYWSRLLQIHRATYKHGYSKLFNGGVEHSWDLGVRGVEGVDGACGYWGGRRGTPAGKRLAQLGK